MTPVAPACERAKTAPQCALHVGAALQHVSRAEAAPPTHDAAAQGRPSGARAPVIDAARALVGENDALAAARLLTAWATGFISMELAGAFRMGGDLDEAFEYGLERLRAGLET